ncbi:TetR/AcrR family transcriptional regulator [Sphingomonas profundi]|uniref:TetR/AcrR family transcriptional regulator n=1 Tax=Alterirhizorhabdus profundi TaxID=2681549 RepID=UPI0012E91820|nr:TetR/AcrR family transcriptional regulator [Sphingomonas profundi]
MSVADGCGRGEGRRERRRGAMIAAARALFLERGFDAVTLGEIVRRSGGSLSTFYELFENKAGVLGAIVAGERFDGQERLGAIVARRGTAAETLRAIAASIHEDLTGPEVVGIMRIVMAESLRNAAFARSIYENAHVPRIAWLTDLFAGWAAEGHARIANPVLAAEFFLGLILHAAQMRALFCEPAVPQTAEWHECMAEAVNLFVAGYAITGEAGRSGA